MKRNPRRRRLRRWWHGWGDGGWWWVEGAGNGSARRWRRTCLRKFERGSGSSASSSRVTPVDVRFQTDRVHALQTCWCVSSRGSIFACVTLCNFWEVSHARVYIAPGVGEGAAIYACEVCLDATQLRATFYILSHVNQRSRASPQQLVPGGYESNEFC